MNPDNFSVILTALVFLAVSGLFTKYTVAFFREKAKLPQIDRFATKFIGRFETIFFACLYIFLIANFNSDADVADRIFIVTTAWIGIKVLGYEADDRDLETRKENKVKKEWQDQTSARYIFLIGTLLNISLGLLIGFFITKFWV